MGCKHHRFFSLTCCRRSALPSHASILLGMMICWRFLVRQPTPLSSSHTWRNSLQVRFALFPSNPLHSNLCLSVFWCVCCLHRHPQCCVWWAVPAHCCHVFFGRRDGASQKPCAHLQPCGGKAACFVWQYKLFGLCWMYHMSYWMLWSFACLLHTFALVCLKYTVWINDWCAFKWPIVRFLHAVSFVDLVVWSVCLLCRCG